ncbi:MAG: hypothetical protein IJU23_08355 [Proteobacteria bacterium]|nr:hypothetical protein [Pseudomonadota bacterium]
MNLVLFAAVILISLPVFADVAPIRPPIEHDCGVDDGFNEASCINQCNTSYDSNMVYLCNNASGNIRLISVRNGSMYQTWSSADMTKASIVCNEVKRFGESQTLPELKKLIHRFVSGRKLDCSRAGTEREHCELCNFQDFTSVCFQQYFLDRCIEGCKEIQQCVDRYRHRGRFPF